MGAWLREALATTWLVRGVAHAFISIHETGVAQRGTNQNIGARGRGGLKHWR